MQVKSSDFIGRQIFHTRRMMSRAEFAPRGCNLRRRAASHLHVTPALNCAANVKTPNLNACPFMKITKISLVALLAACSLLSLSSTLRAQEEKKPTPPAAGAPGAPGERPRGPGMSVDDRLARMTEQLSLTDEQKPKVKALL
jgi:hypothetical protein